MITTFVVNFTPHAVRLLRPDGTLHQIFESRGIARAAETNDPLPPLEWNPFGDCGMHDHLPLVARTFGGVTGLPEPKSGVAYIVSQIVADACPDRTDLLVPALVDRGPDGQVIGCRAFATRRAVRPTSGPDLIKHDAAAGERGGISIALPTTTR